MSKGLARVLGACNSRSALRAFHRISVIGENRYVVNLQAPAGRFLSRRTTTTADSNFRITVKRPEQYSSTVLRSSASHSLVAALFIIASTAAVYRALYFEPAGSEEVTNTPSRFAMAVNQVPEGHFGNLTAEQEKKLKEFWQAVASVSGWSEVESSVSQNATKKGAPAEPTPEQSSGGWGLSRFRKSEKAESNDVFGKSASEDDKFGLTKQFNEILAKQSAESIRDSIWEMTKHDHPDVLALRFLRARKWDVQKALIMFIAAVNWRKAEMKVDDNVMRNGEAGAASDEKSANSKAKQLGSDFLAQLRMGKSFLHGSDREGRPICVVRVRLHHGGEQSAESIERYTVHVIETARLLLQPPIETAVCEALSLGLELTLTSHLCRPLFLT